MIIITAVAVAALIAGFHFGAGSAHWRHRRRGCSAIRGHRQPRLLASLGRGPFVWLSAPIGGEFRLGRRL